MKTVFLVTTLLINGHLISGDKVDGWYRYKMPSMAACAAAAKRGNAHFRPETGNGVAYHCEVSK